MNNTRPSLSRFKFINRLRKSGLIIKRKMKCLNVLINPFLRFIRNIEKTIGKIPVFLPFSRILLIWDSIHVAFILYNMIVIPFDSSFYEKPFKGIFDTNTFFLVNVSIFLLNSVMEINSAYYEKG